MARDHRLRPYAVRTLPKPLLARVVKISWQHGTGPPIHCELLCHRNASSNVKAQIRQHNSDLVKISNSPGNVVGEHELIPVPCKQSSPPHVHFAACGLSTPFGGLDCQFEIGHKNDPALVTAIKCDCGA